MQKLVTDITYLPFAGRTLYLSSILDLFNGMVERSRARQNRNTRSKNKEQGWQLGRTAIAAYSSDLVVSLATRNPV